MSDPLVVQASRLDQVYSNVQAQKSRYMALQDQFSRLFHQKADRILRSPGRVNIIGDHIDYCMYSVLPMAVEQDMVLAYSLNNGNEIIVSNTDSQNFPTGTVVLPEDGSPVPIDAAESSWINYFKCGLVVAQDFLQSEGALSKNQHVRGMNVLMDGNVPTGGGLSSSAAFVVCATLSVLLASGYDRQRLTKRLLTRLSTLCEQHVGVNSGGMDQSASIWGLRGHALNVAFLPELSVKPFAFPLTTPKLAFVVANSLITSNKHETAPVNYNLRVVEVTLAAAVMAKYLGLEIAQDGNLKAGTLRGVQDAYFAKHPDAGLSDQQKLARMLELVEEALGSFKDGQSTQQAAEALDMSEAELKAKFMSQFPVRYRKLQLYKRTFHVYSEALRVLDFMALLNSGNTTESLLVQLGSLMNEAHKSAQLYFQHSAPELDDICSIALAHGAYGSRVTGAGWGGSSVHLVSADQAPALIDALTSQYYHKRFPGISQADIDEALLATEPGSGTVVFEGLEL